MQVTQSYARPSAATENNGRMNFELSTESARSGVHLSALVLDSPGYARAMLALHRVVSSDLRFKEKDHSAYQEWVQARYLEMLDEVHGDRLRALPEQQKELAALKETLAPLRKKQNELLRSMQSTDLWQAKSRYWKYLYEHNEALWWILDPVVSVHPDGVIFEVFSLDESSYGRVVVPMDKLETLDETQFGTTNVDFSQRLADELKRVRTYRPVMLDVGAGGVSIGTTAGAQFEKKIDLPPSWVRGFLQVQSAAGLPGDTVVLSAETVARVLAAMRARRERESPRSLRFQLTPGECPKIVIDPWGVEIDERVHPYDGKEAGEIRIWGRRRLFVLEDLLTHASKVEVKLLGTGMPSYWSVEQNDGGHRFEIGLSGWTSNDWSAAARFDLLSSMRQISEGDVEAAATQLEKALKLSAEELAARSDLNRETAQAALQQLCRDGRAMYEMRDGSYRWRQLLPFPAPASEEDSRLRSARQWVQDGNVKCKEIKDDDDLDEFLARQLTGDTRLFAATVKGKEKTFEARVALNADGRATFAQCDCGFFRANKLRRGPCGHILATSVVASQMMARTENNALRFQDQTWVFTGALSQFTRETAETTIREGGGAAAGSVSKNTTYLVVGERAGSKLEKAQSLGVPVLTESEFVQVLDGKSPEAIIAAR